MIRTPLFEGVKQAMRKWKKAHKRLERVSGSGYKEHARQVAEWERRRPGETPEEHGERIRKRAGDVDQSIYDRVFAKHRRRIDTAAAEEERRRAKLERAEEKKRQKALKRAPTPTLDPVEPAKIRTVAAMTQIAPRVRTRPKKLFPLSASVMHDANLAESDERRRRMERMVQAGDHDAQARLDREHDRLGHAELVRQGKTGAAMGVLVRRHEASHIVDPHSRETAQARADIHHHHRAHGDHPADYVKRRGDETPRAFAERLMGITLANGSIRPGMGEHGHGSINYDHDAEDEHGHGRNAQALHRAWEREVPEGYAELGHKTRGNEREVTGSYVNLRTGKRPEPRRR